MPTFLVPIPASSCPLPTSLKSLAETTQPKTINHVNQQIIDKMAEPVHIEIRKVLFSFASPQVVVTPPTAITKSNPLSFKNDLTHFVVDIAIKENLTVRFAEWEKPLNKAVNALAAVPKIESLTIKVTFESKIHSAGQTEPKVIPQEAVAMIIGCFRRLRGVAYADVSGLGADGDNEALVAHLTATKTVAKDAKNEKASKKRASHEEEGVVSGEPDEGTSGRQIKRARTI